MKYTGVNGEKFIIPHLKIQLREGDIIHPRQNKRVRCKVDGNGYVLLEKDAFLPKDYLRPEVERVLEGSDNNINYKAMKQEDSKTGPELTEFVVKQKDAVLILDAKNKPNGVKWEDIGMALRGFKVVNLNSIYDTDVEKDFINYEINDVKNIMGTLHKGYPSDLKSYTKLLAAYEKLISMLK